MNRRDFIKGLLGGAAAAIIPASVLPKQKSFIELTPVGGEAMRITADGRLEINRVAPDEILCLKSSEVRFNSHSSDVDFRIKKQKGPAIFYV